MAKSILICHPGRCGSHWLLNLLQELTGLETLPAWPGLAAIPPGHIVGTREQLDGLETMQDELHILFLLRDPRDVETSMRIYSEHVVPGHFHVEADAILENLGWFRWYLETAPGVRHFVIRYEQMWIDSMVAIKGLFAQIDRLLPDNQLLEAIYHNSFGFRAGRKLGCEDVTNHLRKGVIGDWTNHWSAEKAWAFDTRFEKELCQLGY